MTEIPKEALDRAMAMAAKMTAFNERADAEGLKGMRRELAMRAVMFGGSNKLTEFMLKYGRDYPVGPNTYAGPRGEMKQCFMNATHLAHENPELTYVEGYVATHGIPIDHAWCVGPDGFVVDPTMAPDADGKLDRVSDYFGVAFHTPYLRKATVANKVYGLLGWGSQKTLVPLVEMGLEAGQLWLMDQKKLPRKKRRKAA
jgi:hypothetical protein